MNSQLSRRGVERPLQALSGHGTFVGYASLFGQRDQSGDIVLPGSRAFHQTQTGKYLMPIPFALITSAVTSLMNGPLTKIIESYVSDLELRRKLQAELETSLISHLGKSLELQQAVVLAEVKSEHWLTRNWRPILMMTLVGFLVLVGFVLPLADLAVGHAIPFNPRWQALPEGFWNFLTIGVGGYIGGRSMEKIASTATPAIGKTLVKTLKTR